MEVTLRPFLPTDLQQHLAWAEAIGAGSYMSRVLPRRSDDHFIDATPHSCWYIIVNDGADVGSVWLEKENIDDDIVQLGILIGREDLWGKGVGRRAIEQAILESRSALTGSKVLLNVRKNNIRAQACYSACAFHVVSRGVKTNANGDRIEFITMERKIPNNSVNQTLE
jgi:RimJ/RimL family protein N-acetyltransferase